MHIHVLSMTLALSISFLHIFVLRGKIQRRAGQLSALSAAIGVPMGLVVGLTNTTSAAYGGMWAVYGWMWMAGSSFFLLSKGVLAVLQGQIKSHKRWMTRFYVSMWCDFLIFRLMLVVVTPFVRQCISCAFLPMIYLSPLIGLIAGELVLRNKDRQPPREGSQAAGEVSCLTKSSSMWATARLIATVGCENVHLRCDATDVAYVEKSYSDGGVDLAPAKECLQKKCNSLALQRLDDATTPRLRLGRLAPDLAVPALICGLVAVGLVAFRRRGSESLEVE
ncbi:unnamed protein product [Durusdinium trenchii]|uniref:Uncharacterized protein n=1 Tax=Durusdinium trenchii TaxID=1381693 RepID=A0ABP0QRN4_9DINO